MMRDGKVNSSWWGHRLINMFQTALLTRRRAVDNCRVRSALCCMR